MPLNATVQDIQGDIITLSLEDGQTLRVSATSIEGTTKIGMAMLLLAVAPGSEDAGRQALGRHLLNEIIGTKAS